MSNNVYQVNNRVFRDVFLSILAAIAVIYYTVAKTFGSEHGLRPLDWGIIALLGTASVFFINKAIKRGQTVDEESLNTP